MFDALVRGAALGLATGTACLVSCGPVYLSYLLGERRSGLQSLRVVLVLNLGRFIAYALFGALVGLLGGAIPPQLRTPLAAAGYILFSVFLLMSVIRVRKSCGGCGTSRLLAVTKSAFLLGVLTGFSICPAFLIALTGAFESSGALSGMMLFIGFFAGTTVYMLPFAFLGLLTRRNWFTGLARILSVAVSVYFFAFGLRMIVNWISPPPVITQSGSGDTSTGMVFAPAEADTIFVVSFRGYPGDHGVELAAHLSQALEPVFVSIEADSAAWVGELGDVGRASPVIAPWWVDPRSGESLSGWQESFAAFADSLDLMVFAVEYEPWCTDRGDAIAGFLDRYSFRVDPDSGFTFLMLNSLECDPAACDTCPAGI
jgi:sulfite exporter TauE/SafE